MAFQPCSSGPLRGIERLRISSADGQCPAAVLEKLVRVKVSDAQGVITSMRNGGEVDEN